MRTLLFLLLLLLAAPSAHAVDLEGSEPVAAKKTKKTKKSKRQKAPPEEPPAEAAKTAGGLTFGWAQDSRVLITEEVVKKGNTTVQTYWITLAPRPDGNITVSYSDFAFLSINGTEVTPEMKGQLGALETMTGAIPDLVITPEGVMVGLEGMDAMITEVITFLRDVEKTDPQVLASTEAMLRSPQMEQVLQGSAQTAWNSWAGDWVAMDLAPGETWEGEIESASPGKTQPITMTHHGEEAEFPGKVHLSYTTTMDKDLAMPLLMPLIEQIAAAGGAKDEDGFTKLVAEADISIALNVRTITDPATLRPVAAFTEKTVVMKLESAGVDQTQVESHAYRFAWPEE